MLQNKGCESIIRDEISVTVTTGMFSADVKIVTGCASILTSAGRTRSPKSPVAILPILKKGYVFWFAIIDHYIKND